MANKVEIIITAADKTGRALKGVQGKLQSFGQNVQKLGHIAMGGIGVLTGATTAAGGAMLKLASDAAEVENVQRAFEGVAESADTSSQEMLAALEEGSAGMIAQRDLMEQFNKAAGLVSTDFAKRLPDAMQYLQKVSAATGEDMSFLLNSLTVGVGRMSSMILDNLGIQASLAEATEEAAQMFGVQASELTKAQQQAGMMQVVMSKLQENTANMPEVSQSAAAGVARMRAQFQNAKDALGTAFLPVLTRVLNLLAQAAQAYLPQIISFAEKLGAKVAAWVPAFQQARATISQTIGVIKSIVGPILTALQPITKWIGKNVELQDVLITLGAAIASVIIPALVSLISTAAPIIAAFGAILAAVVLLRRAWESNFLGIRDAVQTYLGAVKEIFAAFRAAFQGDWDAFAEHLKNAWKLAWESFKTIVTNALDAIKSIDWGAVGKAIINGIKAGVKAAARGLANAVVGAAKAALGAVRGLLGIGSPSKVFAEIGSNLMEGMALGIEGGAHLPTRAIAGAVNKTVSTTYSPTINVNGTGDPRAVAGEVMRRMRRQGLMSHTQWR